MNDRIITYYTILNRIDMVNSLLQRGADRDGGVPPPLKEAVYNGYFEMIAFLSMVRIISL
jgi:hypothetical protein